MIIHDRGQVLNSAEFCWYPAAVACIIKDNFNGFIREQLLGNYYQLLCDAQICW